MTNFQATLVNVGYGQLAVRDSLGRISQKWTLANPKCVIGSHTNCNVACNLPGIVEHHVLMVIGARQVFLRALSPGLTRRGENISELVVPSDEPEFAFEVAGHHFIYSRKPATKSNSKQFVTEGTVAANVQLPQKSESYSQVARDLPVSQSSPTLGLEEDSSGRTNRLRFTFVRALEKNRSQSQAGQANIVDALDSHQRPAWVEEIVREALRPVESRLDDLSAPLDHIQRRLRRDAKQRKLRRDAKRNSPPQPQPAILPPQLMQSQSNVEKQVSQHTGRLEQISQHVHQLIQRLSSIDQSLSSSNSNQQDLARQSIQSNSEIARLQQEMLGLFNQLRVQLDRPATSDEQRLWQSSVEAQLAELHSSMLALDDIKAALDSNAAQTNALKVGLEKQQSTLLKAIEQPSLAMPSAEELNQSIHESISRALSQELSDGIQSSLRKSILGPLTQEVSDNLSANLAAQLAAVTEQFAGLTNRLSGLPGELNDSLANLVPAAPVPASPQEVARELSTLLGQSLIDSLSQTLPEVLTQSMARALPEPVSQSMLPTLAQSLASSLCSSIEESISSAVTQSLSHLNNSSTIATAANATGQAQPSVQPMHGQLNQLTSSAHAQASIATALSLPAVSDSQSIVELTLADMETEDYNRPSGLSAEQVGYLATPPKYAPHATTPEAYYQPPAYQTPVYQPAENQPPESVQSEYQQSEYQQSEYQQSEYQQSEYQQSEYQQPEYQQPEYLASSPSEAELRSSEYQPLDYQSVEQPSQALPGLPGAGFAEPEQETIERFEVEAELPAELPSWWTNSSASTQPEVGYDTSAEQTAEAPQPNRQGQNYFERNYFQSSQENQLPSGGHAELEGHGDQNFSEGFSRSAFSAEELEIDRALPPGVDSQDNVGRDYVQPGFESAMPNPYAPLGYEPADSDSTEGSPYEQQHDSYAEDQLGAAYAEIGAVEGYAPYSPESYLPTDDEAEENFAEPVASATQSVPAVENPTVRATEVSPSQTEDGDESVEDYMRRLLARMRGVSESEITLPGSVQPKPADPSAIKDPSAPSAPVQTETVSANDPMSEAWTEPFDPDKYVPRGTAPEKNRDLNAMRELANTTARSAIQVSARRRQGTAILIKSTIAFVGLIAGFALLSINGARVNIAFIATVASFLVALIWGYDTVTSMRPLIQSVKTGKKQATTETDKAE